VSFQKSALSDFAPGVIASLATCQRLRLPPFLLSCSLAEPWCGLNNINYQITVLGICRKGISRDAPHRLSHGELHSSANLPCIYELQKPALCFDLPIMLTCVKWRHLPNVWVWRSQSIFTCRWSQVFLSPEAAGKLQRQQTPWFREGCMSADVKHFLGINTFIETTVFLHQHVNMKLFKGWSNPLLGEISLGVLSHTQLLYSLSSFLGACRMSSINSRYGWEEQHFLH